MVETIQKYGYQMNFLLPNHHHRHRCHSQPATANERCSHDSFSPKPHTRRHTILQAKIGMLNVFLVQMNKIY